MNETESKHIWMQIFDELKVRGVEDMLFISMDGVSLLEEGAKAIFKDVVVHRCIVHLIRNSIKYVPSKDYKAYTAHLKKVYGSLSLKRHHRQILRSFSRNDQHIRYTGCKKEMGTCGAVIRSWKCCKESDVHVKCHRINQFQLS